MCSGGLGRGGFSGTTVLTKQYIGCVLEGTVGQTELTKCKAVESSFSEQVDRKSTFRWAIWSQIYQPGASG